MKITLQIHEELTTPQKYILTINDETQAVLILENNEIEDFCDILFNGVLSNREHSLEIIGL